MMITFFGLSISHLWISSSAFSTKSQFELTKSSSHCVHCFQRFHLLTFTCWLIAKNPSTGFLLVKKILLSFSKSPSLLWKILPSWRRIRSCFHWPKEEALPLVASSSIGSSTGQYQRDTIQLLDFSDLILVDVLYRLSGTFHLGSQARVAWQFKEAKCLLLSSPFWILLKFHSVRVSIRITFYSSFCSRFCSSSVRVLFKFLFEFRWSP